MATENKNITHDDEGYEIDTLTNERLIKDHSYDGIKELDNELPPWWKWLFYLTIIFSIVYMVRLFVFQADDLVQENEYQLVVEKYAKDNPNSAPSAEFKIVMLTSAADLAAGKETWTKICSACHLVDGGGIVGPNMTDNYWIHGNKVEDLYKIVTNGVIEKGMIPYNTQLSEKARLEVISYILTDLVGSTPATPKAPEGTAY
ncbi:MAG: c-type cytochrome [Bacteroidetes bacterium]|nr:c-type cytochrome [Bacteroidota bacterium]